MNRHFIFTSGRSGSNYLANTLNESPDCLNYGEVLGEWTVSYKLIGRFVVRFPGTEAYLNLVYKNGLYYYLAQAYSAFAHIRSGRPVNFKKKDRSLRLA